MQRFKVGDMAIVIGVGHRTFLQPCVGTVCEVIEVDARCDCLFCLLRNGRPTTSDYYIELMDGNRSMIDDPQLAPLRDPDAEVETKEQEELRV